MADKAVKELRKRLGEKRFQEIVDHVRELKKAKKSPDEIARSLNERFPEIGASTIASNLTPINVSAPDA